MKAAERFKAYTGLPKPVYILFIVRIVNSMGNFVYPFLTFFLTERIGLSAETAGTYFLASAVSQTAGSIIGGKLTDHFGRKRLLVGFMSVSAACFIPCSFLGSSILIPVLLIISGFFSGASQPANTAMVTDLSCKENRKQVFSLLYMGSNIGFAVGPMIAGFLYNINTNLIFYGNSIAIIISSILVVTQICETMPGKKAPSKDDDINDDEAAEEGGTIRALLRRPLILLFALGKLVYQLVYSCIGFAIPLQLKSVFGSTTGPQYYGIMASSNGLVVIILTMFITSITVRMKPLVNMSIAGIFYAVGFGMVGYAGSLPMCIAAVAIYTIGEILDLTNAGVYIANHSPSSHRGRFSAIISMIGSAGFALGPFLFGKFIGVFGLPSLWLLCFAAASICSIFMFCLRLLESRYEKKAGISNTVQGLTEH